MNMFETSGWRIGSLFGVDISLSMGFFLIVGLNLIFGAFTGGMMGIYQGALFGIALFVSLVIHEMGHALVAKRYKLEPSILLHGFGGLCFHKPALKDGQDALVVLMGPVGQIIAGLAAWGLMVNVNLPRVAGDFTNIFMWISLLWGGINLLLPIYPLDGGKLLHLLLRRFMSPASALTWALRVSIGVSIPLGLLAIYLHRYLGAFIVMFIVMDNYNMLQAGVSGDPRPTKKSEPAYMRELIDEAARAFEAGDFRESYRLCHQARSTKDPMAAKTEKRMWELLAVSAVEIGETEEAKTWLERAPDTELVRQARAKVAGLN